MSELTVTIRDSDRSICGHLRGIVVDQLVAALSADPETIEELQMAVLRFIPPDESSPVALFRPGEDDRPHDMGVCIIDLAARYIAWNTTYSSLERCAAIEYSDSARNIKEALPYHLADDWKFDFKIDGWNERAGELRSRRQAVPRIDARKLLLDGLAPFVADECFAAQPLEVCHGSWAPPVGWKLRALPERSKSDTPPTAYDAMAEIHARWLITPREDLQGRAPREILLAQQNHIDLDLQHRSHQWSMLRQCPPGIETDSIAYRFGGFGAHENLMYYDLVRHLLTEAWNRVVQPSDEPELADLFQPDLAREELIATLRHLQQEWFELPCEDAMSSVTPARLIELERRRIPYTGAGEEHLSDCDCPTCEMLAEGDFGPMFIHFDGCNNDDDFPFTSYLTREAWEAEQRSYEDFNRRFSEEQRLREAGLLVDEDRFAKDSIWKSSFSALESEGDSPTLRIFGIAGHLGELVGNLQEGPSGDNARNEAFIESLNRYFGNIRAALQSPDDGAALLEPAVERFCQELDEVAAARSHLLEKCLDLQQQVRRLVGRLFAAPWDDDLPF